MHRRPDQTGMMHYIQLCVFIEKALIGLTQTQQSEIYFTIKPFIFLCFRGVVHL